MNFQVFGSQVRRFEWTTHLHFPISRMYGALQCPGFTYSFVLKRQRSRLLCHELSCGSGLSSGFSFVACASISSRPFSFTAFCTRTSARKMSIESLYSPVHTIYSPPRPFHTCPRIPSVSPLHVRRALLAMTKLPLQAEDILQTKH